ncbi:hypothetical protein RJ640_000181, partial [Escallonia rubra]
MAEIVVAEPSGESSSSSRRAYTTTNARPFTRSITTGRDYVPEQFDSEKLPVALASEIQRFLRVANLIELEQPRVAYLCRFHAFEVAHNLDRNSSGRGVRQFKTSLLQRLEQDEELTIRRRREKSDIRELRRVYQEYKRYILKYGGECNLENSVLNTALADTESTRAKSEFYVPYNILPLDQGGVHQAIMQLPEIKVAVASVRNIRGLPFLEDFRQHVAYMDLFDWLQICFGFQKGNVANQREHLILLLANTHIRKSNKQANMPKLGDGAVDELMKKFFKNYTEWCKFLGRKSSIRLPYLKQEAQQYKLLYIGLYLLIWGEAANLRFMPECLCYIFHHMAYELHSMLIGDISIMTGEKVMPAYGGGPESFLNNVVTPIYSVIYEEAMKNQNGMTDHSTWRNYDDLNEYFWSPDCFQIGWPMRQDHDFFFVHPSNAHKIRNRRISTEVVVEDTQTEEHNGEEIGVNTEERPEPKWLGKTNFVEIRSFCHIFRSFDRMWSFLILALQAMIIMATHDLESPLQVFDATILEDIMSIFITSAVLKLVQGVVKKNYFPKITNVWKFPGLAAILDIVFTWKARCTMDSTRSKKYVLKVVVAVIWTIVLPVLYASSRKKYTCYSTQKGSWLGEWCYSSYMVAVAFYLLTNSVNMVLFFVPAVGRYIETSNFRICTFLYWWSQPRLYVGRGMQESQLSILKYTVFWVLLLLSKFSFSYNFEIKPLIAPTRQIVKIGVKNYDWHELFPKVFGGLYGVLNHLGEIRTLGMLRSRFQAFPSAFTACLISPPSRKDKHRRRKWFFSKRFKEGSETEKNSATKFVLIWNQIITSFREEDLISNRELDLMKIPSPSEFMSGLIRWPVFLLANKVAIALSIAKDFVGKDSTLLKKIKKDDYMYFAVKECYESLKYILEVLVVGDLERRIISGIVDEIEESIGKSSLLEAFKMGELPALHAKCVDLVELLVEGNEGHHDKVVIALQDVFELVTNDMMLNGSRTLDSLYACQHVAGDAGEFFSQIEPQLFASKHSIHFPLPDSNPLNQQ